MYSLIDTIVIALLDTAVAVFSAFGKIWNRFFPGEPLPPPYRFIFLEFSDRNLRYRCGGDLGWVGTMVLRGELTPPFPKGVMFIQTCVNPPANIGDPFDVVIYDRDETPIEAVAKHLEAIGVRARIADKQPKTSDEIGKR